MCVKVTRLLWGTRGDDSHIGGEGRGRGWKEEEEEGDEDEEEEEEEEREDMKKEVE